MGLRRHVPARVVIDQIELQAPGRILHSTIGAKNRVTAPFRVSGHGRVTEQPAPGAIASLQANGSRTQLFEQVCRVEAGKTRADDDHVGICTNGAGAGNAGTQARCHTNLHKLPPTNACAHSDSG